MKLSVSNIAWETEDEQRILNILKQQKLPKTIIKVG